MIDGPNQLIFYASVYQPTDDVSLAGGAIDVLTRINFDLTKWDATVPAYFESDGADTGSIDLVGWDGANVRRSEVVVLTGTTPKASVNSYKYVYTAKRQATSASRIVTMKQGSGGAVRGTIPLNEKGFTALWDGAIIDPDPYYAKCFGRNNSLETLTNARIFLAVDTKQRCRVALEEVLDGTGTMPNRRTAPGAAIFVDDNIVQTVIGGSLASLQAQGLVIEFTPVPASDLVAYASTGALQLVGVSGIP